MRIGIDARFYQESGVGRYLRNLISNLKKIDKENEYFIFLLPRDYKEFEEIKNFHKVMADFPWYGLSEQLKFPKLLNNFKLDLIHFPHFNVPIFYKGKFIVTIHDLIHQHYHMRRATTLNPLLYAIKHLGYKKIFKNAIKRSQKIITPSNQVKDLLIKEWGVQIEKIMVTHEGVDENILSFSNKITQNKVDQTMNKFNIKPPYIFYVGNAHPHKNVEGLIKAFLKVREQYQYLQLVLSGFDHYFWQKIRNKNQNKNIIFTGKVTDEELVSLYHNAQCFVMPSFEEGFGIPILEAMTCGAPVVCSKAGSLPEVGGDAAIYFDPNNNNEMSEKINLVLKSDKSRKDLIKKGKERVKEFSWEKLCLQTLNLYKQCF